MDNFNRINIVDMNPPIWLGPLAMLAHHYAAGVQVVDRAEPRELR